MSTEHSFQFLNLLNRIRPYNGQIKCSCPSIRELLKVISQILLPLMIGIFTLVIALQQHNLNKENRKKDIEIASQLRQQQYQLDEQRRAQELALDEARRAQDLTIADNKQRDAVFNVYIRDLTNLLLTNNYVLSRAMLNSVIRPMTLTILRQLDPSRKVLLIKFLYESKMLRTNYEEIRVDLKDGDLNGIRLGHIDMRNLSLVGTSLINASFLLTNLIMSDFEGADLTNALFIQTDLSDANFYRTRLINVQFNNSILTGADLALADLTNSIIDNEQLALSSSYNMAKLPNGSEGFNRNLIDSDDECSLYHWKISPKKSINLTKECYFLGLNNNITMIYRIPIYFSKRLIEKQQALFQFYLKTNIINEKYLHIDFIYSDQYSFKEIYREKGTIMKKTKENVNESFFEYLITANYPSNAYDLEICIYLNKDDIYTDFIFYLQHYDYDQY